MATPYADAVLKLIEVAQNAWTHALTLQEMYEQSLEPAEYDRIHAKQQRLIRDKFQPLRDSVENPQALAGAIVDFRRINPTTWAI